MGKLSRNAQVVGYVLGKLGAVGHTRLLKLVYLADVESRRVRGHPVSGLVYRFHHHGPFDAAIYTALRELEREGVVAESPVTYPDGKVERQVSVRGDVPHDALGPLDRHVLSCVCRAYGGLSLGELLRKVYETDSMKAAERGKPLPMHMEDNRDRGEVGDLEVMIADLEEAERGNYVDADEFFDALQAAIISRR